MSATARTLRGDSRNRRKIARAITSSLLRPRPPPAPRRCAAGAPPPTADAALRSPEWPWNVRVGANSPSLWPTMFSVANTGTNLRPLCTANVTPSMSGMMVERRDQVLSTFFDFWR